MFFIVFFAFAQFAYLILGAQVNLTKQMLAIFALFHYSKAKLTVPDQTICFK
jgi:hypothetical protein